MATYASLRYNIGTQLTGGIPTASIADNAITLAKMAGGTDGNIITYDASGNPAAVATGSSGQALTSAGSGAPPTMSAQAGGGKIVGMYRDVTVATTGAVNCNAVDFADSNSQGYAAFSLTFTPENAAGTMVCQTSCLNWREESAGNQASDFARWTASLDSVKVAGHGHGGISMYGNCNYMGNPCFSFTYTGWTSDKTLRIGCGYEDSKTGMLFQAGYGGSSANIKNMSLVVLEFDTS
tara:strand:- start:1237 stop:1947 length:711 start_codon:yes stop_codon:yes gene_type:complete